MRSYGFAKVSQEVVGVAEVTVGSPLSGAVSELLHYTQIRPVCEYKCGQTLTQRETRRAVPPLTRSTRLPSVAPS